MRISNSLLDHFESFGEFFVRFLKLDPLGYLFLSSEDNDHACF